jgi:hypothetical protein
MAMADHEHVVALDPGGRSGWATARMSPDLLEITGTGVLRQDHMARWLASQQGVNYYVPGHHNVTHHRQFDVVVAESWRPFRKQGSLDWIEGDPLLSAQHLGQIRLIADLSGATYREYGPHQKEAFVASMPDALKALDVMSNEQHDQDARMHLWGYFFEEWFIGEKDPEECVRV